mgnify:CR=1 FL=1
MAEQKNDNKCAHPSCHCVVPAGNKYCSDYCKKAPEVGLIVKFNNVTNRWEDELGRNWNGAVRFRLPDLDVFAVNASTLTQTASYAHVGTTLFNMVANPVNGNLYVSNTEAFNLDRFEGPGQFGGHTVQGHLAETRITVISGSNVQPRHLNKHIDYTKLAGEGCADLVDEAQFRVALAGFQPRQNVTLRLYKFNPDAGRYRYATTLGSVPMAVPHTRPIAITHHANNPDLLTATGALSMIDMRDAMLAADQMRFGGANQA